MFTSYAGQVREGRPVILEEVRLPENASLIITVLDGGNEAQDLSLAQKQNKALKRLSAALKEIDDEPFDEEFDTIISQGFTWRELDL